MIVAPTTPCPRVPATQYVIDWKRRTLTITYADGHSRTVPLSPNRLEMLARRDIRQRKPSNHGGHTRTIFSAN